MTIRLAIQEDLQAMTDIYNQAIVRKRCTADTKTFTLLQRQGWFDAHQNEAYPLWVYEIDGKIAGYLYLSGYRPGREAMIKTVEVSYYLDNAFQGHGIGTKFLDFGIKQAKALDYKTLVAILLSCNIPSIRLLEKFGFKEWGRMPEIADFDGSVFDHLYYGLKL